MLGGKKVLKGEGCITTCSRESKKKGGEEGRGEGTVL